MKAISLIFLLAMAGCATTKGLELTEADTAECAAVGCTAWSERQLHGLAAHFFAAGVRAGKKSKGNI